MECLQSCEVDFAEREFFFFEHPCPSRFTFKKMLLLLVQEGIVDGRIRLSNKEN